MAKDRLRPTTSILPADFLAVRCALKTFVWLVFSLFRFESLFSLPWIPLSSAAVTTASMFLSRPSAFAVRIVSYNVLSSHLGDPSHFTTLDPTHLEASNRLPLVLEKLDYEIAQHPNTIVCLQEVSHDWAAAFHTYFSNKGYHLVTGLHGTPHNGYMGEALAYPTERFQTLAVDISRLSDKRITGWPVAPDSDESLSVWMWNKTKQLLSKLASLSSSDDESPPVDHWAIAQSRFNILLTATLQDKETGAVFCVGNYHMPCLFYAPMVMSIHTEMAAKHVQTVSENRPYVLAGDWNIKPDSSTYQLLTTGKLDMDDESYPTPKYGMTWAPTIDAMRSAYAQTSHGEPDFTNYARIKENDPFIDTIDYIFLSKEWSVTNVKEMGHRNDANGPFPNAVEPSDHLLIAATLELKLGEGE